MFAMAICGGVSPVGSDRVCRSRFPTHQTILAWSHGAVLCCATMVQSCNSAERVYVEEGIYDSFVQKLTDAMSKVQPLSLWSFWCSLCFPSTAERGPGSDE